MIENLILNSKLKKEDFDEINEKGFLVIKDCDYVKKNLIELQKKSKELMGEEKDKGGWEGKEKHYKEGKKFESGADRLGGLISKGDVFLGLITIPEILAAANHVIKDDIKICGLNLRNPIQGMGSQSIHIDGFPRNAPNDPYAGIVVFIFLDDCKIENGAMRIISGTHKKLGWPDDHIDINKKFSKEERIVCRAGTIVIANLNIWHAGAKNLNGDLRRVIMLNIKNRKYDQLLNYKKYLSNEFKEKLSPEEKYLLAVRKVDKDQILESGGSANKLRREYFEKKKKKFSSVAKN